MDNGKEDPVTYQVIGIRPLLYTNLCGQVWFKFGMDTLTSRTFRGEPCKLIIPSTVASLS